METALQISALHDERIDIGIVRSAMPPPGIEVATLLEDPMVAVLPAEHPLSAREHLDIAELRDEPFIGWPRSTNVLFQHGVSSFHDQVIAFCQTAGFEPRLEMDGTDIETALALVSAGVGVTLQPASYAAVRRDDVCYVPLPEAPRSEVQIAWPAGRETPVARRLIEIARAVAKQRSTATLSPEPGSDG
jgi:DNA-binding transcriptional LysR family regulator